MCLTKVYYNTYADGAQDITEKAYPCRDSRSCSRPHVRRYDRKFPFAKLGDIKAESRRSLSERQPTPYFSDRTPGSAKSPSPSRRRDSGVYLSGSSGRPYDYRDPYGSTYDDTYGYRPSRRDRDRDREPRLKRSSTAPHIVYLDRDRDRSSRSRSRSSSRDIPVGLVPLADEYGRRRRHSSSSSRDRSRDAADHTYAYPPSTTPRRRTDDPAGYVLFSDADERRSSRRRRMSTSSYPDPSPSADRYASGSAYPPPRRASTVVHHADGSLSADYGTPRPAKQLRWEDQVRRRREQQNAEIASRAPAYSTSSGSGTAATDAPPPKGILKRTDSTSSAKGKGRDLDEIEALRRSMERMGLSRGRDRERRRGSRGDDGGGGWAVGRDDGWEYGYDGGRRKRSKVYADDGYRY